uniref:ABC transporter domain-containing protein n=1 Tax=Arcella intermedia TaxID=1963864 RepID=A0A6B2LI23_9EUKA
MLSIFRIVEIESGRIIIDGEDIRNLGLDNLRKNIAMIPQSPTIFSGTIRSNLDPFGEYTDEDLWEAIDATHLSAQINNFPEKLDASVSEGGSNLSVGTKQLMCLARALLKKSKILIMDEATANVDYETDVIIQTTIKKAFANATVITVAHRINTILNYDKVMVLEKGKISEFKNPQKLLSNPDSIFSSLAKESGIKNIL